MEPEKIRVRDEQRRTWDTFSAGWKKWDDLVARWLSPVGDDLLESAQLHDTSHLLDVAAGTGEPGLTAAERIPNGRVTLTDLSGHMLDVIAETATRRGLENIDVRQCDAGSLPFADGSFDAVTCRFGFMFFPDIDAALREMARVARPGARVCSAVWSRPDANPWATTIMNTISTVVEMPSPAPGSPSLFRCASPGFMPSAYRGAGFEEVSTREIEGELVLASPEQYWAFMTDVAAPVVAGLASADDVGRAKIEPTVLDLARRTSETGEARFHWSALVTSGVRAGATRES